MVRVPPGAYAPRQGILLTVDSLDPRIVNGYQQDRNLFLVCHVPTYAGHSRHNNNELFVRRSENYLIIIQRCINRNYY